MSVFVGGSDFRGLTPDLEKTFGRFGIIESVKQHGTFAFIKYECFSDAQAAVSLLNKSRECGGLRVEMAKKQGYSTKLPEVPSRDIPEIQRGESKPWKRSRCS
ncbi:hypothetical protein EMCRGX_G008577 [Ephydatia muelleri]